MLFALAELVMAIFSKSQSVLADTVYDSTELVVIGLTIYIIPLFYKPVTEKHPFGYAIIGKYFDFVERIYVYSSYDGFNHE